MVQCVKVNRVCYIIVVITIVTLLHQFDKQSSKLQ